MLQGSPERHVRIEPPAGTPPPIPYLRTVVRNPLQTWPAPLYSQPLHRERILGQDTLFVMDSKLIQQMLIDEVDVYRKSDMMLRLLEPALGNGMLNAHGANWRRQRRIVAPIFRPGRVQAFVETMLAAGNRAAAHLESLPDGASIRLSHEMMRTTFDVVAESILIGADRLDVPRVERAISDYLGGTGWTVAYSQMGLPKRFPYPGRRRVVRARDYLRGITADMVAERRRSGPRNDLVQALIDARDEETGEGITDIEIVDNLLTFIAAGHETTALALTWTLYLLSLYPDIEARVLDEIRSHGGTTAGVAPETVGELTYTRQVVEEAMRLYPPAPAILRTPVRETTLGDVKIGPKTAILIPIYCIHRHEAHWENPERFDPDRFRPEIARQRDRFAYMPFGGGSRVCIGMGFSMLETVAILTTIVPRFRFESTGDPPIPTAQVTLRPSNGMPMILHRREASAAKAA